MVNVSSGAGSMNMDKMSTHKRALLMRDRLTLSGETRGLVGAWVW